MRFVNDVKKTVIILDNCSAHASAKTVKLVEELGFTLLFLPVCCSRLNPIERLWGLFKKKWR